VILEDKARDLEVEQNELDKVISEASKVNAASVKDSVSKIVEIKKEIAR